MEDTNDMNAVQSLHNFWSGFGIPAYDENTVPDNTPFPYITYAISEDFFGYEMVLSASIWYLSSSWVTITEKEDQISEFIGRGGRMIDCNEGAFWIKRGNPWAQRMNDPADDMIRRIILNYQIEFIT